MAVREVPFATSRGTGSPPGAACAVSRSGLAADVRRALACCATRSWRTDYDDRAHDSRIPLQRYWQRRFRHVTELVAGEGPVLDIGCRSSRIIRRAGRAAAWPSNSSVAGCVTPAASGEASCTGPDSRCHFVTPRFRCVLCSQVIEHVPKESPILDELCRVLAPGGRLVLGTPDYANWQWVYIEKLLVPGATRMNIFLTTRTVS